MGPGNNFLLTYGGGTMPICKRQTANGLNHDLRIEGLTADYFVKTPVHKAEKLSSPPSSWVGWCVFLLDEFQVKMRTARPFRPLKGKPRQAGIV